MEHAHSSIYPPICPLCGSGDLYLKYKDILRHARHYDVFICKDCGLGITHPFPDKQLLTELYSTDSYRDSKGSRFIGPIESIVRRLRAERLRKINALRGLGQTDKKARMLDIGCGRGLMLSLAKQAGWDTVGIEFSNETAAYAKQDLGLDIRTGSLLDMNFERESFDVITFWHSLEHIQDAVRVVRKATSLLKPGGLMLISAPNFQSLQSCMSREKWFHLDLPYHLYHFSASNLKKLMSESGLKVVRVEHGSIEFNPFGLVQSLLNMSGTRHNLLYDMLRSSKLKTDDNAQSVNSEVLKTALLLPLASAAACALAGIEILTRRGGTVTLYAKKCEAVVIWESFIRRQKAGSPIRGTSC